MDRDGLTKLMEECGELITVAAKKSAFLEGAHPDGKGDLDFRIANEMADVLAAIDYAGSELGLPPDYINARRTLKIALFHAWSKREGVSAEVLLAAIRRLESQYP